ncbi:MAG TPA: hypothetical protein VHC69_20625 [Polyangiaceae bacterium]|nr:hypothetical protein [Polyangiaceae bacterium]
MKRSEKAASRIARWVCQGAVLFAAGCSAAADPVGENPSLVGSSKDDLHLVPRRPPLPPRILRDLRRHLFIRPPHWPHGGAGGAPGAAGAPASGSGGAFSSGGSASLPAGGATSDAGGATNGAGGEAFGGAAGAGTGGAGYPDDPCGDGIQIFNACDDGNTVSGDGCSATCEIEPGYVCPVAGQPCREPRCGDGYEDQVFLPSDGANDTAPGGQGGDVGAGGSPSLEAGGAAGASGSAGTYYYEQCDDGNTVSGDGCSATCEIELGYVCTVPDEPCRQPRCGDGVVDFYFTGAGGSGAGGTDATGGVGGLAAAGGSASYYAEGCDDGNLVDGDGCDAMCQTEPGYVCDPTGGPCRKPHCGDGIVDCYYPDSGSGGAGGASSTAFGGSPGAGGETASGGAAIGGAAGASSSCVEQCDDGNTVSGDGCSATCTVE